MRQLVWQDDTPNESGWFWIWPHGSHRPYVAKFDVVVDEKTQQGIRMATVRSPHGDATDMAILPNQVHKWAGPLPNPPRVGCKSCDFTGVAYGHGRSAIPCACTEAKGFEMEYEVSYGVVPEVCKCGTGRAYHPNGGPSDLGGCDGFEPMPIASPPGSEWAGKDIPDGEPYRHAWYSRNMHDMTDASYYAGLDGSPVLITAVSRHHNDSGCNWDDEVYLGVVKDKWLGKA